MSKPYKIYLCGEPETLPVAESCSVDPAFEHTPSPKGYLQWHEWAEAMTEAGFVQEPCGGCGRLHVWVPSGAG